MTKSSEKDSAAAVPTTPLEDGQIDLSEDRGVLKKILKEGTGDLKPLGGCKVSLHYTGTLLDGTKFDSSLDRNEPFEFEIGKGMVIRAFDIGIASMKNGEKAILTCAPEYAYGSHGSPPNIPANATLIFEIELLSWKGQDLSGKSDYGIEKFVLVPSDKRKKPADGTLVQAHITGTHNNVIFDDRDVSFELGEVPYDVICEGVQTAIKHSCKDETCKVILKPEYAFGIEGNKKFKTEIPPNATVEYTITLTEFEKDVKSWKLNEEESLEQAKLYKEKGTKYLKENELKLAIKLYEKANSFLSNYSELDEVKLLTATVHLNIALAYQKLDDNLQVKQACANVLELEPNNIKALYRRGTSCLKSGETDKAFADFKQILQIEPQNKAAQSQVAVCKRIIKESNEKEKKLYANMFTKFASVDYEKEEHDRNEETDVLTSCGEWNMEEEARKEADRAFKEVDQNVVMI